MNSYNFINNYIDLKPKEQNKYKRLTFQNNIELLIKNMFTWYLGENSMPTWLLELLLSNVGVVGFFKKPDGKLCYGTVSLHGELTEDGTPSEATVYLANNEQYSGKVGEDILLCWNNNNHSPEFDISRYAYLFAETDTSIECCIQNSRPTIVNFVKNNKIANAIKSIFKQRRDGNPLVLTSESTLAEMFTEKENNGNVLNLGDPDIVDKLQNLSKFHDDLLRRLCNKYGISLQSTGKMAQINSEELQGYESFSMINPLARFEERQLFCQTIADKWGIDVQCSFGKAWQISFETNQGSTEELEEDILHESFNKEEKEKMKK